jgi:hypothetical protein
MLEDMMMVVGSVVGKKGRTTPPQQQQRSALSKRPVTQMQHISPHIAHLNRSVFMGSWVEFDYHTYGKP